MRNFKDAYDRWKDTGKPVVTEEVKASRWSKCEPCEWRDKEKNICLQCGCPSRKSGCWCRL
jgi:hypothetical protein